VGGSPVCLHPVVIPLIKGPQILDVGCGFGKWGYLCMANYWETKVSTPSTIPEIMGIDGFMPNVEMARRNGCYTQVSHAIIPPLPFKNRSFDTVLMIEVIEHLQGNEALKLIEEAKRITRNQVIISTPNFPSIRQAHETITGFNELEAHISYWSRDRLRELGFTLYGAGWRPGFRYWRGILHRLGILVFYDKQLRPTLSSLSLWAPYFAENIVGVWKNENSDHD